MPGSTAHYETDRFIMMPSICGRSSAEPPVEAHDVRSEQALTGRLARDSSLNVLLRRLRTRESSKQDPIL